MEVMRTLWMILLVVLEVESRPVEEIYRIGG
jgi:hypothetical protein